MVSGLSSTRFATGSDKAVCLFLSSKDREIIQKSGFNGQEVFICYKCFYPELKIIGNNKISEKEMDKLVSQSVIPSKSKFGGAPPFAFTEQGVSMLSSVLSSKKAIQVNLSIIRALVVLRRHLSDYRDLKSQFADLELEMNTKFKDINQALHYLLSKDQVMARQDGRKRIGYQKS